MDLDFKICYISKIYFKIYNVKEAMNKHNRPYVCLLKLKFDYLICIPFRSNIKHKESYMFKKSKRSIISKSGIDFSKMILLDNDKYLVTKNVVVDQDEYNEVKEHKELIINKTLKYINEYINHLKRINLISKKEFNRKYKFTTLKYFHDVLLK